MFSLIALYLQYRQQAPAAPRAIVSAPAAPAANDRMQAAALRLAA